MTTPVYRRPPVLVMETGVNPVPGGGPAGWVSGNPSGLADGATAPVVFDLGPEWDQYPIIGLIIYPVGATSLSAVTPVGSDTPTYNYGRRLTGAFTVAGGFSQIYGTCTSANGSITSYVRPAGRYVVITMTNTAGSGVMGASRVTLVAYTA